MCSSRRPGVWFAVIAVVLSGAALAPARAVAASCTGNSHTMALSAGTASPGSGTTSTDFTFTVVYTDDAGCDPSRIVVAIPGLGQFALSYRKGDPLNGATFGRRMTLPPGTWDYRFEASSGSGAGRRDSTLTNVDPARVRVTAPPRPTPEPPEPTPRPTPKPTPEPDPTPRPTRDGPDATAPVPTASPSGPDRTPAGHGPRTQEPDPAAAVRPGGGPGGPPLDPAGNLLAGPSELLPRAVQALLVSTGGTIVGLVLYALLGTRLLVPAARRRGERGSGPPAELPR